MTSFTRSVALSNAMLWCLLFVGRDHEAVEAFSSRPSAFSRTTATTPTASTTASSSTALAAKIKTKKKKKTSGGGSASKGFSGKSSSSSSSSVDKDPTLSQTAKDLLKEHNGDLNAAQSAYFALRMKEEQETMRSSLDEDEEEGASDWGTVRSAEASERKRKLQHEAKVKAAWDSIAAYLPVDYAAQKVNNNGRRYVDPVVKRRKKMIAKACLPAGEQRYGDEKRTIVLDVGCGDGAIVPYLDDRMATVRGKNGKKAKTVDPSYYRGIDIAERMVETARTAHPNHAFDMANFADDDDVAVEGTLDTVLFDGSLQFFLDRDATLARAVNAVRPDGGRVVLSHVQGNAFVVDELQRNSFSGACNTMPSLKELESVAERVRGVAVVEKDALVSDGAQEEIALEDKSMGAFYLVALERRG